MTSDDNDPSANRDSDRGRKENAYAGRRSATRTNQNRGMPPG